MEDEPGTAAWVALRINCATFGIFDVFDADAGRRAHLAGKIASALIERSDELFVRPPTIEKVDILSARIPATPDRADAV